MWFFMWWWIIPLMFFLMARGGRRRYYRDRRWAGDHGQIADLQRTVKGQQDYIEQLETRLSRVEEGLEFAERLLAERAGAAGH
jgi:hypothetical protein